MREVIYQDEQRTIEREGSRLLIQGARPLEIDIHRSVVRATTLSEDQALRKAGRNPSEWYTLAAPGGIVAQAILPSTTRPAVEAAIKAMASELETERARQAGDPETIAWRRLLAAEETEERLRSRINSGRHSDTGIEYRQLAEAEAAVKQARADYVAFHGEDGLHLAQRKAAGTARRAEREERIKSGFITRGLD